MCMIAGLIFVVHNKIAIQVLFHFFILVQVVIYIVNTTLYGIFGDVLSFDLMKLGNEAKAAFSFDLIDWGGIFINLGIYVVVIVSSVLLLKYNKKTYTIKKQKSWGLKRKTNVLKDEHQPNNKNKMVGDIGLEPMTPCL